MKRCYIPAELWRAHRCHKRAEFVGNIIVAVVAGLLISVVAIGVIGAP